MPRASQLQLTVIGAFVLCALALGMLSSPALAKNPWEKFKFPELGDITIPNYERHVLDNGLVVYLMEDNEWPLVEGRILVHTGSVYEPAGKVGLASVTGDVLRTGGTATLGADELDETLERMGGSIESFIGDTQGQVNFSFLSKDAKRGLQLVGDVLRHPAFDEDKIDVAKTGERAGIARRNDELLAVLQREVPKAVWGPDHPYARHTEYTTINAIERQDLVDFYEYYYHPNRMMIAVWGEFDSTEMLADLRAVFGDWKATRNPVPPLPEPPKEGTRQVLVANKDDVTQTWFAVGHVGMKADDPDYYSMSVMNRILGGGFSDRLFNEVRSNLGLAYGVGSSAGVGMANEGTFLAYCGTKNGTVEQALGAVLGEIEKMRESEVTPEELSNAKEAMLNSHVFNFERRNQTLTRLQNYEFLGYPEDFLEKYTDGVRSVSIGDVKSVASRRIRPDEFSIVAVGKKGEWEGDLTSFGPVEEIDITIPEPEGPEFPEPTAETIERGRAILAGAQGAMGGSAVKGLTSIVRADNIGLSIQGMNLSASVKTQTIYPDRTRSDIQMPFGEMVQAVDGEAVWMKGPQGMQELSGDDADRMRSGVIEDPTYIVGRFDQFQVQALEGEDVNGTVCDVVLVWVSDDKWMKFYFDSGSHALVKTAAMERHMATQAVGLQETFYEDIKSVGGIAFAHRAKVLHDGEELMSIETQSIQVNASIESGVFVKPAS